MHQIHSCNDYIGEKLICELVHTPHPWLYPNQRYGLSIHKLPGLETQYNVFAMTFHVYIGLPTIQKTSFIRIHQFKNKEKIKRTTYFLQNKKKYLQIKIKNCLNFSSTKTKINIVSSKPSK